MHTSCAEVGRFPGRVRSTTCGWISTNTRHGCDLAWTRWCSFRTVWRASNTPIRRSLTTTVVDAMIQTISFFCLSPLQQYHMYLSHSTSPALVFSYLRSGAAYSGHPRPLSPLRCMPSSCPWKSHLYSAVSSLVDSRHIAHTSAHAPFIYQVGAVHALS